jgi:hypothetical protein
MGSIKRIEKNEEVGIHYLRLLYELYNPAGAKKLDIVPRSTRKYRNDALVKLGILRPYLFNERFFKSMTIHPSFEPPQLKGKTSKILPITDAPAIYFEQILEEDKEDKMLFYYYMLDNTAEFDFEWKLIYFLNNIESDPNKLIRKIKMIFGNTNIHSVFCALYLFCNLKKMPNKNEVLYLIKRKKWSELVNKLRKEVSINGINYSLIDEYATTKIFYTENIEKFVKKFGERPIVDDPKNAYKILKRLNDYSKKRKKVKG